MGPTWGPFGQTVARWAPRWPHKLCCLGCNVMMLWYVSVCLSVCLSQHHKNTERHTAHTIVSWPNPIMSAPWLHAYVTDSFHIWFKYNLWGDDVPHTISRYKVERSRSQLGWLELFALSSVGLCHLRSVAAIRSLYVLVNYTPAQRSC